MKIANPLFDKRISPRFDCAQSFWVAGLAEDALVSLLSRELEPGIMVGSGGRRRGRWRLKRKSKHRGEGQRKQGMGRGRSGAHGAAGLIS